jgi:hypothetical protein
MGFHTALSPAAAHSGWEDHFSADLLHYLHHRYCDCNYAAGINFDVCFGTFQASLRSKAPDSDSFGGILISNPSSTALDTPTSVQTSNHSKTPLKKSPDTRGQILNSKATLEGWWKPEHAEYQLGVVTMIGCSLWGYSTLQTSPFTTATVITIGPAVWALILAMLTRPTSLSWRKTLLAPFDKDPWWSLLLHFGLGTVLGVLPSTYLLYLVLR